MLNGKARPHFFIFLALVFFLISFVSNTEIHTENILSNPAHTFPLFNIDPQVSEISGSVTFQSWMGVYIEGIKVGYSHSQEIYELIDGKKHRKKTNETWMKVSRLGGRPVEIRNIQEELYDADDSPLKMSLKIKMSESETEVKAEILPDRILFKTDNELIKELPYKEKFYFDIPLRDIIDQDGLSPKKEYNFKILDILLHSLILSQFEVIGKENLIILGKRMNLWHVRTKMTSVVPIVVDDWIDEEGHVWKSVNQASFLTSTSLRMSREMALEVSERNYDIAYSSVVESNVVFAKPQDIQKITFKVSGVSPQKVQEFPFDSESQRLLEINDKYAQIQTSSLIFKEEDALLLPIEQKSLSEYLKSTSFCQSDDPEIMTMAAEIVNKERNSWRAAKKIAEWVKREMTANYDIGFATAKEILRKREGDCSEYTTLSVALFRAAGIPAKATVGIMYAQGFFAYHMWPEVYVGKWVGLDTKWMTLDNESGEYYTDATHLKFGHSKLDGRMFSEMMQAIAEIIGNIKLEISDYDQAKNK